VFVYVARHGETDWNRAGRYQGQRESQLTELGEAQAQALAVALAGTSASRVISSPLQRCVQTALPIARRLSAAAETDPRLLEIAHGRWEGRLRDEIERDDAARMEAWRDRPQTVTFEEGESLAAVAARWRGFAAALPGNNDLVVVTHDVVVRLAILNAGNRPLSDLWKPRVENGGYALFEVREGAWFLLEECHDAHLGTLLADTSGQAL